jgi:hypothetical protein
MRSIVGEDPMNVRFPIRSEFLDALRLGIKLGRSALDAGRPIEVLLKPGGYGGRWSVIIHQDDDEEFEVVGSMKDPTRFPQRIRVAARALYLEGAYGRFEVSHDRDPGVIAIRREV